MSVGRDTFPAKPSPGSEWGPRADAGRGYARTHGSCDPDVTPAKEFVPARESFLGTDAGLPAATATRRHAR
jgi:hypothetical protein